MSITRKAPHVPASPNSLAVESRRAVIGALAVAPAALLASPMPTQPGVSSELLALVADYKRLDQAADDYFAQVPDPSNEQFDAVVDPLCDAIWAVVRYPVQTVKDLNLKISLIEKEDQFKTNGTTEAVIADIRRLAGSEAVL